jgi:uncharacterized damage-inducible protein DinB
MPDLKPPHLAGDERASVLALLQFQRESLVRKVTGVDDGDARRSPVGSGTSLLWLMKHIARAEAIWVLHRFADLGDPPSDEVTAQDTLDDLVASYRDTWRRVDEVVAAASLDETCRRRDGHGGVNLRWILLHLLEETARHAGHADILRELIDGDTGR